VGKVLFEAYRKFIGQLAVGGQYDVLPYLFAVHLRYLNQPLKFGAAGAGLCPLPRALPL
jgi:hypothetical protein